MRRCAWSLAGLLIAVCVGAAAAGSTVTSAHPAGRRRLTYEYAPTADATPYCRLQNPSVCWGNTHRFLEVTANGPFDGIDLRLSYPKSALADLDGDGDLDLVVGNETVSLTYIENTGTTTAPVFVQRTGTANPFDGIDVGWYSAPAFGDLDNDGDLDLVVGEETGSLNYIENTGTSTAPVFVQRTGSANPFDGIDLGDYSTPALGDFDNDGDLDLVVGAFGGSLTYIENTGTPKAPAFMLRSGSLNPFNGNVVDASTAAFADLDGDGDLDLVVCYDDGSLTYSLLYLENTGTSMAWAFVQRTGSGNPFYGASDGAPALIDLDGDGDLDLVVGEGSGDLTYIENTGTTTAPVFVQRTGTANPFDGINVGWYSAPAFGDLDNDGTLRPRPSTDKLRPGPSNGQ